MKRSLETSKGNKQKLNKKQKKKKERRKFDVTKYRKRYVALHIAYFGQKYRGYASQAETKETIEHYIFHCIQYEEIRNIMISELITIYNNNNTIK